MPVHANGTVLENTTYLAYVDDSGDENHDLLTALLVPVDVWTDLLALWKGYRRWIERRFDVPPDVELHAVDLAKNARANPGDAFGGRLQRSDRQAVAKSGFRTLSNPELKSLRFVTAYRQVPQGSGDLYPLLVELIEEFLDWTKSFAVVWFDGTATSLTDHTRAIHRSLPIQTRRVLEDPCGYDSRESHLIQIADLAAYSAFWAVKRDGGDRSKAYLRSRSHQQLIASGLVWPCSRDEAGMPAFAHRLGISGYPPKAR